MHECTYRHQDSGLPQKTVMVGFPPENNYTGIGVFSHAIKLSHRMPAPFGMNVNEPRLLGTSAHVRLYDIVLKLLYLLE